MMTKRTLGDAWIVGCSILTVGMMMRPLVDGMVQLQMDYTHRYRRNTIALEGKRTQWPENEHAVLIWHWWGYATTIGLGIGGIVLVASHFVRKE